MDESQIRAISSYKQFTKRTYVPGDMVLVPIDALMFATYQTPWPDLDSYVRDRCVYDPETNEELIWYVTENWSDTTPPPIYIDILNDGVALVDGLHRTMWYLLNGYLEIPAQLNVAPDSG